MQHIYKEIVFTAAWYGPGARISPERTSKRYKSKISMG